ncbi:DUF3050 domain-containing protein [Pseudomarimonas arenosa]|uniref:DUF3050 domain-containing protein n=1 Tax=Pseudomarimonas arenosa TaxID=2774145 RepID=A0AAW3ZP26_9GAMM|nr:DUF3050 domain-containing protein [Pseudomarimonas arenosa]MBD8526675.1 DUF3050 domain-containing protein [Pseudomarimonas arenosa]
MSASQFNVVNAEIHQLQHQLERHAVFSALRDLDSLRGFMQIHVFAVWDFMTLTKRLQRDFTCTELPWMPPADSEAARMINEIVLGEESDVGPNGRAASHLDIYLTGMREAGACTHHFDHFLDCVRAGSSPQRALREAAVPAFIGDFVCSTLDTAFHGSTVEVLASFLYGRENVIPRMFQALLEQWQIPESTVPSFSYYLRRHIELDADTHGPLAERIMDSLVAHSTRRLAEARSAARAAILARIQLWDGTWARLDRRQQTRVEPAYA